MRKNQEIKQSIKVLRSQINTFCAINSFAKTKYYVTIESGEQIKLPIDAKTVCTIEGGSVMHVFLLREEADLKIMLSQLVYRGYTIKQLEQKVGRLQEIGIVDDNMIDAADKQFKHCFRSFHKASLVRLIDMSKDKINTANNIIGNIV